MSPGVSPLIEGDMTAIENVGCCGSRSLAQWTARIVLDPHSAEVHRCREGERALSPMGLDLSAGRLATHTLHREKHHETESDYRT